MTAPQGHAAVVDVRRVINDHIAEVATRLDDTLGEPFDFMCECGDLRCPEFVRMTLDEFRQTVAGDVRAH